MSFPINIHELLTGQVIEWDRLEFKEGWNPLAVGKTMCAFANDINNWGGGYIVVGVREAQSKPQFPPVGLDVGQLDAIQKELIDICHRITPTYFPISAPVEYMQKMIFVIWVPGGEARPYSAPAGLGKNAGNEYYIRRGSSTIQARGVAERNLMELAAKVPFDDRVSQLALPEDLSLTLIRSFLKRVGSELFSTSDKLPFADLCRQMRIARGPVEFFRPVNVGLLFFSLNPEQHFRGAQVEIVLYTDESGSHFTEKIISGPLDVQIEGTLRFLKNTLITEEAQKDHGGSQTQRFFNFPPAALKEVIANAVYHKSYELPNPIEINCFPDRIEILSFPGPVPPMTIKSLQDGRIIARDYRNRRVGDFLKEMRHTEGRGTGIPKTRAIMLENGSPSPEFSTDEDRSYFLVKLPIHPFFRRMGEAELSEIPLSSRQLSILDFCRIPRKRREILQQIGLSNHTTNYQNNLVPLMARKLLIMTHPQQMTSNEQRYYSNPSCLHFVNKILGLPEADTEDEGTIRIV